jgi:uncharacterized protein (UPF0297 family)
MAMPDKMNDTAKFDINLDTDQTAQAILVNVLKSLRKKGYNPINQLVGYLVSGDPTYVTSYNNARVLIQQLERDELLEELVASYIKNNLKE